MKGFHVRWLLHSVIAVASVCSAYAERPKLPAMPDGFTVMEIPLGEPFSTLELIAWNGRPIIGTPLKREFLPPPHPGRYDASNQPIREFYPRQARYYLTVLNAMAVRDAPDFLRTTEGRSLPILLGLAQTFLAPAHEARFVNCPGGWAARARAKNCYPRGDEVFLGWKGSNEFAREDTMNAFNEVLRTWFERADGRLPMRFWHIYQVRLGDYDSNAVSFPVLPTVGYELPDGDFMRHRLFSSQPWSANAHTHWYPKALKADRERAKGYLRQMPERTGYMVVPLAVSKEDLSDLRRWSDTPLHVGRAKLYSSLALDRLVHDFGQIDVAAWQRTQVDRPILE